MSQQENRLPGGKHFTITWSIQENYGGMTNALLHRARAFVNEAGTPVEILTFDWRESYGPLVSKLQAKKIVIDGVVIKNIWDDLMALDFDNEDKISISPNFSPNQIKIKSEGGKKKLEYKVPSTDKVFQRDYYRPDGTLFITDKYEFIDDEKSFGSRYIYVCNSKGEPVKRFSSSADLYYYWLDVLIGTDLSYLIVDSKFSANFISDYNRNNVVKSYLVHGSHLDNQFDSPYSPLSKSRRSVFLNMEKYDAIALLTDRQRYEVKQALGDLGNLHVVPNSHRYGEQTQNNEQASNRDNVLGVIMASLTKRKQIDHAVKAIKNIVEFENSCKVVLDCYGLGDQKESIHELINSNDLQERVYLKGHTDNAIGIFRKSSFSLLTSAAEGFPLVLLETMSAGCIPIAYNMRYGPSQIIEHGVDGFLVEPDNIEQLSKCILEFINLPLSKKEEMRASARHKAEAFHDAHVIPKWNALFIKAYARKLSTPSSPFFKTFEAKADRLIFDKNGMSINCTIIADYEGQSLLDFSESIFLSLKGRKRKEFYRANVHAISKLSDNKYQVALQLNEKAVKYMRDKLLDLYVEVCIGNNLFAARVKGFDFFASYTPYSTIHNNLSFNKH